MSNESNTRSLAKTISWRLIVLVVDFSLAYFFTKDFSIATTFAIVKLMISSFLYYGHERVWNGIRWGKS